MKASFIAFTIGLILILSVLVSTSSCVSKKDPKFHYGDSVEVTSGFLKNCKGEVRVYYADDLFSKARYLIHMNYACGYNDDWIYETDLKESK